jgi:hypothetical protein
MARALGLLLTLLALVAAGCGGGNDGGGSKTAAARTGYQAQVREASVAVQRSLAEISDQTSGQVTAATYARRLDQSAAALDKAVGQLRAIRPPAEAAAAHAELVDGCRDLAGAFRAIGVAARQDDAAAIAKALRGVAAGAGTRKIGEAQAKLKALGIPLSD